MRSEKKEQVSALFQRRGLVKIRVLRLTVDRKCSRRLRLKEWRTSWRNWMTSKGSLTSIVTLNCGCLPGDIPLSCRSLSRNRYWSLQALSLWYSGNGIIWSLVSLPISPLHSLVCVYACASLRANGCSCVRPCLSVFLDFKCYIYIFTNVQRREREREFL